MAEGRDRSWRPSTLLVTALAVGSGVLSDLMTNTVPVSSPHWLPYAVWGAVGTLAVSAVAVELARFWSMRSARSETLEPSAFSPNVTDLNDHGETDAIDTEQRHSQEGEGSTTPPYGTPPGHDPVPQRQDPGEPEPRPGPGCPGTSGPEVDGTEDQSRRHSRPGILAIALIPVIVVGVATDPADDERNAPPTPVLVQDRCGLPPDGPRTTVFRDNNEVCYGFVDSLTEAQQTSGQGGFGRDAGLRTHQYKLLKGNEALGDDVPTVVLLTNATCTSYRSDGHCDDANATFTGELQQLQGLLAARATPGAAVRIIIASAGYGMIHAPEVAEELVAKKSTLGDVAVIGGNKSYESTRTAIKKLNRAGIPFIATTLTADRVEPGQPFLPGNEWGYLQLPPTNTSIARAMVQYIRERTPTGRTRSVVVYHLPKLGDEHTESLALDVGREARGAGFRTPPIVDFPSKLDSNVCAVDTLPATGPLPSAVVYVDRPEGYREFARTLSSLCPNGPAMVIGNDSLNRIMNNDRRRASLIAPWPMAYFTLGMQCTELWTAGRADPNGAAAQLLTALQKTELACLPISSDEPPRLAPQAGPSLSLTWDAVMLALRLIANRASATGQLPIPNIARFVASNGVLAVVDGRLTGQLPVPVPLCVLSVGRPPLPGDPAPPPGWRGFKHGVPYNRATKYCDAIHPKVSRIS